MNKAETKLSAKRQDDEVRRKKYIFRDISKRLRSPYWILFAISFATFSLPVLLSPLDFWDGRIFSHIITTNDQADAVNFLLASGWFLAFALYKLLATIFIWTKIDPHKITALISILSVLGVANECRILAHKEFRLYRSSSILSACLLCLFPAFSVALTSVMGVFIFCSFLSLASIRLIMRQKKPAIIALGIFLLLTSFQLNSNFLFGIGLSFTYCLSELLIKKEFHISSSIKFASVSLLSIFSFAALRLSFQPWGLYEKYNSINITRLIDPSFMLSSAISFGTYPALAIISAIAAALAAMHFSKGEPSSRRPKEETKLFVRRLLLIAILIISATLPYMVVGKMASIRGVIGWEQRHALLLSVPCSILAITVLEFARGKPRIHATGQSFIISLVACIPFGLMQSKGTISKIGRAIDEQALLVSLSEWTPPPTGYVAFEFPSLPQPYIDIYEANWLMKEAFALEQWETSINRTGEFSSKKRTAAERSMNIMKDFQAKCKTLFKVSSANNMWGHRVKFALSGKGKSYLSLSREVHCSD